MAGGGQVADQAFVTLATNDTYALGALVLAHSLRGAGTTRQIAIMVTPGVTQGIRQQLSQVFDLVQDVDVLDSRDQVNLALLTRPDLGITFTKFHCWRLTQYSKCVFLDADTLVLSNVDELFDREELSAAPDAGWPDCFNSGVFVFRPSEETYQSLLQFAVSQGSFDGGDQGLLNMYFSDWATKDIARHLPFVYNCVSQAFYSYLPAFKFYGKNVKIVHFIGSAKPWHHAFNTATGQVELSGDAGNHKQFLQRWWQLFMDNVQPNIDPGMNPSGLVCLQAHLIRLIWQPPAEREEIVVCPAFVPPSIQTYYEQPVADSTTLVFVESRQDRPYSFFETFYSEPPMTSGEEYPTPQGAYDAKTFEQELREFVQAEEDNHVVCSVNPVPSEPSPPPPEPKQEEAPQHFHGQIDQSHHAQREAEWKQQEEEAQQREEAQRRELEIKQFEQQLERESLTDISYNTSGAAGDTISEHSIAPDGCSGKLTESDHSGAASAYWVGFQEGVAKIGTFSQAELGDPERRYQWERGQIDYTGIDSFDNIQKRLQQMMDSKEQAESLGPVSGEPPKPQEPAVPLTPSGKPLKPAIKQPVKLPVKLPAKSALKK